MASNESSHPSVPPKKRASGKRPKKRRFYYGNRYMGPVKKTGAELLPEPGDIIKPQTRAQTSADLDKPETLISQRKVDPEPAGVVVKSEAGEPSQSDWNGNRIIDIDQVFQEIQDFVVCNQCFHGRVKIREESYIGLWSKFVIECDNLHCKRSKSFQSSKILEDRNTLSQVNCRSVYATECLGLGHSDLRRFCAIMDLPPPVTPQTFDAIVTKIRESTAKIPDASMVEAVKKAQEVTQLP